MTVAPAVERAELCMRVRVAAWALSPSDWTMGELRALVNLMEAAVKAHHPVDEVGNLVYLAGRKGIRS
jgi:hypothetical protein